MEKLGRALIVCASALLLISCASDSVHRSDPDSARSKTLFVGVLNEGYNPPIEPLPGIKSSLGSQLARLRGISDCEVLLTSISGQNGSKKLSRAIKQKVSKDSSFGRVVIFYAGHGAINPRGKSWESLDNRSRGLSMGGRGKNLKIAQIEHQHRYPGYFSDWHTVIFPLNESGKKDEIAVGELLFPLVNGGWDGDLHAVFFCCRNTEKKGDGITKGTTSDAKVSAELVGKNPKAKVYFSVPPDKTEWTSFVPTAFERLVDALEADKLDDFVATRS